MPTFNSYTFLFFLVNTNSFFSVHFQHTDMGQACSDSMMHDLSNSKECSDAVTYAYSFNSNANYKTSGSWDNLYKGCVIYANGNMYFNSHSTGLKSHDTRSICKGGNKQFGTHIHLELFIKIHRAIVQPHNI